MTFQTLERPVSARYWFSLSWFTQRSICFVWRKRGIYEQLSKKSSGWSTTLLWYKREFEKAGKKGLLYYGENDSTALRLMH